MTVPLDRINVPRLDADVPWIVKTLPTAPVPVNWVTVWVVVPMLIVVAAVAL